MALQALRKTCSVSGKLRGVFYMSMIITAVVSVTIIGFICAVILNVASQLMYVKVDEREAALLAIMPGANCGACGYPGCSGFAAALVSGEAESNQCPPGGQDLAAKISAILGIEAAHVEQKTAIVSCNGDINARQKKMEYKGIQSCEAAKQLFSGENACTFGCLGYGDCKIVCPSNAICMTDGLARIIKHLCTGCGLCVKICPNKLISIENANIPVFIACKNTEKGAVTRKKCSSGCIACTKCVKECPNGAITIIDNLAVIDYEKCKHHDKQGCAKCADVCVTKCIKKA
jgi:RnfABCDGE-type electron transport complex B subunit